MMMMGFAAFGIQAKGLQVPKHGLRLILFDFIEFIHFEPGHNLSLARARPEDFNTDDGLRLAKPHFLSERGRAETAASADGLVITVFTGGTLDHHTDPGADCRTVGL